MGPKHHKAKIYLNQGLFNALNTFSDLEKRISSLPSATSRGDAFEVFAEAYLNTQKSSLAQQVWPFEEVPQSIKRLLKLDTIRDMGVDGVFKSRLDTHCAYQVKFRTGRGSLKWDELSTFMGLSDQVDQRVLFTNCERLPQLMDDRSGFYCIHGNDLDRLEKKDFDLIENWLVGSNVSRDIKKPREHQIEAINALVNKLKYDRNATAIMACGTGKSLVSMWVAEKISPKSILVLVPSLALIRQLLHEWMKETSWSDVLYLCVCSDPSVVRGSDDLIVHQADLDFPVTTDVTIIRRFLKLPSDAIKIVFTTYQSTNVVCEAAKSFHTFDLAVFDEAHKTAGRKGRRFSAALSDENISIDKRIFFTATPRHYDVRKKDKEGDSSLVYSMDHPEVYGDIAYSLSFTRAALKKIICDYKVVISVVTSKMVNHELLKNGEVLIQDDYVKARQIANQIALHKAIDKYGAKKIFTFHRSVASAQSFTSDKAEGIRTHLPLFETFHVNGRMLTSRRERNIREFSESAHAIMSNARCLTEGVDVPAVDMVAFMAPKRSRVDIVQATGRAMRKADYKKVGYILVPLFVEQAKGESIDEALERTEFGEVWDVLQALQEQDDVLTETIRKMREEKGYTGGYDDLALPKKVEVLGPEVEFDDLSNSIAATCIENIGSLWDERLGQLKAYKDAYDHCNVPAKWPGNPSLGNWVRSQRRQYKIDELSEERVKKLEGLGFSWALHEDLWEEKYSELENYKSRFKNCEVPKSWPENPSLANWVKTQRKAYKNEDLSSKRIKMLNKLSFSWSLMDKNWDDYFDDLKRYNRQYETYDIDTSFYRLRRWVVEQVRKYRHGTLNNERLNKLNDIEFDFSVYLLEKDSNRKKYLVNVKSSWQKYYEVLLKYRKKYGNCNVPSRFKDGISLGTWVVAQRQLYKFDEIDEEKIDLLNSINFNWEPHKSEWEDRYLELMQYKQDNGHCNVPQRYDNSKLSNFVSRARGIYRYSNIDENGNYISKERGGILTAEQVALLNDIDFTWRLTGDNSERWNERYAELKKYYEEYGDADVPVKWVVNPVLGRWLETQRRDYKENKLSDAKLKKLNKLKIIWNKGCEQRWLDKYKKLKARADAQPYTNYTLLKKELPELCSWLKDQRRAYLNKKMPEGRKILFEKVRVDWSISSAQSKAKKRKIKTKKKKKKKKKIIINKASLNSDLDSNLLKHKVSSIDKNALIELANYRNEYGNCNVSRSDKSRKQLSHWISTQRKKYRLGKLEKEVMEKLLNIGFEFDPVRERWNRNFMGLQTYYNEHGDSNITKNDKFNKKLGIWISNQKTRYKKGTLSDKEIACLEENGVSLTFTSSRDETWQSMYHELMKYLEEHGNSCVPQIYPANKKLGRWVSDQRVRFNKGVLNKEKISLLDKLEFIWNTKKLK